MAVRVTTTIITPATGGALAYDLVTLAIAKEELGVTGSASDTQIQRYVSAASTIFANFCNRIFNKETVADTFDIGRARLQYYGEAALQTTRFPIIGSIASLTQAGTALVVGTDYRFDRDAGLLYRLDGSGLDTSWCGSPVVITYDGGYTAIPLDIQDAITRMVRARWFAKDRDPLAKSEDVPGVRSVTWWVPTGEEAGSMPPDVVDIAENYRVPVVG